MKDLCDSNDVYISVRCDITVVAFDWTQESFKNSASFTKFVRKINGTTMDDVEEFKLVMLIYIIL